MDVEALIARAREHVAKAHTATQEVLVGDELVELEFTRVDGMQWASLKATHPPRDGSRFDVNLGYNVDAGPRDYPVSAIKVAGESVSVEQWQALFDLLAAPSVRDVATAVWGLNDYELSVRAGELKKASAGGSKKK